MLTLRKTLCLLFGTLSLLCLGFGLGWSVGLVWVIVVAALWMLAGWRSSAGLAHFCLVASVTVAAGGILNGKSYGWMISSAIFALAAWDLLYLNASLKPGAGGEEIQRYESAHYVSLAPVMGLSFLIALLGGFLSIKLPFLVLMLGVVLVGVLLDQLWRFLQSKRME